MVNADIMGKAKVCNDSQEKINYHWIVVQIVTISLLRFVCNKAVYDIKCTPNAAEYK